MTSKHKSGRRNFTEAGSTTVFAITLCAVAAIPLTFSTHVHRYYSIPKFSLLLIVSGALLPLVTYLCCVDAKNRPILLKSRLKRLSIAFAYVGAIALSTLLGIIPRASLFGSFENRMGFITYLCFFVCAVGLVLGLDGKESRLRVTAITISSTSLLVSTYALAQFFGFEPFISPELYTFNSTYDPIVRVASSLGHADYLGNFLLYTTPLNFALTFGLCGPIRWLPLASASMSLCAIVVSGTRGAWLGIIVGLVCLVVLSLKGRVVKPGDIQGSKAVALAVILVVIITVTTYAITSADGFQSVIARGKQTLAEGLSGAGRTLLWRDGISMVPHYAVPGCGPEAFRLAFLPYRSEDLSKLAPQVINESSHNSYLDMIISFGIFGLITFVALIVLTTMTFLRAFRKAQQAPLRLLIAGFLSSFVAVLTHNIFIFDQITTGLYFFLFIGLAQCCYEVCRERPNSDDAKQTKSPPPISVLAKAVVVLTLIFSLAGTMYALTSWQDDVAIRQMHGAARSGSIESLVSIGKDLTMSPRLTGDFDLQFANALALALRRLQSISPTEARNPSYQTLRKQVLDLAIQHAERGVKNSLMPTSGYMLLGTLALTQGDNERLRKASHEASKVDPNFFGSHWLLAEAHLADGDREEAIREGQIALSLNPSSQESNSVLERSGGINREQATPADLLADGRELMRKGKLLKASHIIMKAIRRSNGHCYDCHLALAEIYEQAGKLNEAVAELQAAIDGVPLNPENENIRRRIDDLRARNTARADRVQ
jgi:O-antigen ligase/Tfp pilus assembly protein PilF